MSVVFWAVAMVGLGALLYLIGAGQPRLAVSVDLALLAVFGVGFVTAIVAGYPWLVAWSGLVGAWTGLRLRYDLLELRAQRAERERV